MELSKLAVDKAKVANGVWVNFDAETSFLIGSPASKKYRDTLRDKVTTLKKEVRNPSREQIEKVTTEAFADAGVLDWKGVLKDGKEFKYSPENAVWILENVPSVSDFLYQAANDNAIFAIEQIEGAKQALGESSIGS